MDTEVKAEPAIAGDNTQQEQPSNGANANSSNNNSVGTSPATADSKKETRSNNAKDSSARGSRRDRSRNSRRRSRSPVRARDDRPSSKASRTVYVANLEYSTKWTDIKDLFRDKVGNVRFCQLFEENGRSRGCGTVEFEDAESAKKAIELLHRYEFRGRELVVKPDLDIERDRTGRLILPSSKREGRGRDPPARDQDRFDDNRSFRNGADSVSSSSSSYNTYGLSPQFLSSLGIKGPLNNRVFVANLDYKVTESKLEDVFKLAGKITRVKLYYDRDGRSKGFGVLEFSHPVEAVQAISMFNNQKLFDRILSVRLDKFDEEDQYGSEFAPSKLPSGLEGIGKGLGLGGQPLNISKSMLNTASGAPPLPPIVPAPVSPGMPANVVPPQAASAITSVLTNLAGNLQNLPNLAQSLAQLSNSAVPSGGPLGNSSLGHPHTGYSSSTNELPASAVQAYGGYPAASQLGNGTSQPPNPYVNSSMPSAYGPPPTNALPTSYTSPAPAAPINSYSAYEQRDYRDDKYRGSTSDTIYVRNLPITYNWQNLRDRFSEIGEVKFAEMKGHGTALVRFSNPIHARRACDLMNGIRIENRPIDVDLYY